MISPPNPPTDLQALATQADAAHPEARVILHLADLDLPLKPDIDPAALLAPHIADWNLTPSLPKLQPTAQITVPVILQSLLHQGLTQNQTCVPLDLADPLITAFTDLFDPSAECFTNARFSSDEYSDFFLSSWNPLFDSPMDAGILIATQNKLGLLWIAI